jgi:hypothetical protein
MVHPLVGANQYIDRHIKNMLIKKGFKGGSLRSKLAGIKQSVKNHWEQNKHVYKYAIPATVISALAAAYLANKGGKDHLKEALHDYFPETATVFQENKIEKLQRMNKEREQRMNIKRARDAINDQNFGNPEINSLSNKAAIAYESGKAQSYEAGRKMYNEMARPLGSAYQYVDTHIKDMLTRRGFRGGSLRSKLAGIKQSVKNHWEKNKHIYKYAIPATVIAALAAAYLSNRGGNDNLSAAFNNMFPKSPPYISDDILAKAVMLDTKAHTDPNNATVENIRDRWERKMTRKLGKEYEKFGKLSESDKKRVIDNYWNKLPYSDNILNDPNIGSFLDDSDPEAYSTSSSRKSSAASIVDNADINALNEPISNEVSVDELRNFTAGPVAESTPKSGTKPKRKSNSSSGKEAMDIDIVDEIQSFVDDELKTPESKRKSLVNVIPDKAKKIIEQINDVIDNESDNDDIIDKIDKMLATPKKQSGIKTDRPDYVNLANDIYSELKGKYTNPYPQWQGEMKKRLGQLDNSLSSDEIKDIVSVQWSRFTLNKKRKQKNKK